MNSKEGEIIFAELKRKATLVKWHNSRRKERFGIIAKDIKDKEKLKNMGYFVFDLRDFVPFLLHGNKSR